MILPNFNHDLSEFFFLIGLARYKKSAVHNK